MASPLRKKDTPVAERLLREPHRFAFFQAVRLLLAGGVARGLGAPAGELGGRSNAEDEPLRFCSLAALEFPAAEIAAIGDVSEGRPIPMSVAFWGLVGPAGALPNHYTQLVIDRTRHRDFALRDFLDLFSHRQLALFYRAWEKHQIGPGFERAVRHSKPGEDRLREVLLAISGRAPAATRDRLEVSDDAFIRYGGLFADRPTSESLRQIIGDYLGLPAEVESLWGQWLQLPGPECSRIGAADGHARLGTDLVIGERTWDASSKFRVRIGPVGRADFRRLMPTGDDLTRLCQMIRSYVGVEFDFDVQLVLTAAEVPPCRLPSAAAPGDPTVDGDPTAEDSRPDDSPRLGWDTWLWTIPPNRDRDDAVFRHDGAPTR